ncbi:MAG: hypothetical protein NTV49_13575 [Kiritimatiellaeota bacterium]|nr:hypothetical protein [Kiritimatiellota bacterium]
MLAHFKDFALCLVLGFVLVPLLVQVMDWFAWLRQGEARLLLFLGWALVLVYSVTALF